MSFNFMAAVTICGDFGAPPKIKPVTVSIVSPSICHEVMVLEPRDFFGRNDAKAETPVLWPPHAKS